MGKELQVGDEIKYKKKFQTWDGVYKSDYEKVWMVLPVLDSEEFQIVRTSVEYAELWNEFSAYNMLENAQKECDMLNKNI